jgi:hypothetical protein
MSAPRTGVMAKLAVWLAEQTATCHDMTRLISQSQDAPLPFATRVRMWFHYRMCALCRRYRDQIAFIGKALREDRHEHGAELSADAKDRLKRALREKP